MTTPIFDVNREQLATLEEISEALNKLVKLMERAVAALESIEAYGGG